MKDSLKKKIMQCLHEFMKCTANNINVQRFNSMKHEHKHVINNEKQNENYIMPWTHSTVDGFSNN